ncbi:hypothetical protein AB6A40_006369 [Gnathostoma spinigerum]|uniref:Uncharacterized protein n=1 Tax=Gnathostoma spinigerum TaxID=75299 RepID=A0ABD6EJC9_9BILA
MLSAFYHKFVEMRAVIVLCAVVLSVKAQMIQKCACDVVRPCATKTNEALLPCAQKCKKAAEKIGLNYAAFEQCFKQNSSPLAATITCALNSFPNSCSNGGPPTMIPKRQTSSLELAIANEVNAGLQRSG